MNQTDAMAKYYEEWWENPRDPRGPVFAKLTALVNTRTPRADNNGRALDLGSGAGAIINILTAKGYGTTGVEYGSVAAAKLKARFPQVEIKQEDLNKWQPEASEKYDLTTLIELAQNFDQTQLLTLLKKVRAISPRVFITCPNYNSLQGRWVTWRKFKADFVYLYTPKQFEQIIIAAGFKITYRAGVGFLMPITLLKNFKWQILPSWLVRLVNNFADRHWPRLCSLYYLELE